MAALGMFIRQLGVVSGHCSRLRRRGMSKAPRGSALRSALSATPAGTALGSQQVVRSEFVAMPQRVGALPTPGAGAADLEGFLPIPLLDCVGSHAGE